MEPKFRTSFIPKQPLVTTPAQAERHGPSLLFLISLILFLGSVALAGGVFLYKQYLKQAIQSNAASLERARAAFEPALIQELRRLDSRIITANTLLATHVSPTELFAFLSTATLEDVRFQDFTYSVTAPDKINLNMKGQAKSFAAVVLQSDSFAKSHQLRDPIFSNLNLDSGGNVVFDFTSLVEPTLVSYARSLDRVLGGNVNPATTTP